MLQISSLQITSTGSLTIEFNKNILHPAIRAIGSTISPDEEDASQSRVLQEFGEHDGYFDIEEVIGVTVKDDFEDEDLDKSIQSMDLIKVTDKTLQIDVLFSDPSAITRNIIEPD